MIDAALLQAPEIPELKKLDAANSDNLKAFKERLELLKKQGPFPKLPAVQGGNAFLSSLQAVQDAQQKVKESWRAQDHVKKTCSCADDASDDDKKKHQDADAALALARQNFDKAVEDCERFAGVVLDSTELTTFLSDSYDPAVLVRLVQLVVLTQAKPDALAQWCDTYESINHDDNPIASSLVRDLKRALLLDNEAKEPAVALLLLCLESGGARKGRYCRALEIYRTLLTQVCTKNSAVLKRLALAVALELAEPYDLFDNCGKTQPYRRFDHYARAYANGELDPVLSRLNVWELRHVVDSDAPDEALEWGRTSLQNYRPDIIAVNDFHWRYCQIVRTDVAYRAPTWYKEPKSYDQILSGGGKCGPRAWYGRFICKAFGIPTWGCKQPAHAAMARFTFDGWQPCLGGGLHKSWWDDQTGNDFVLETKARNAVDSEAEYATKVSRLEWVAQCLNEVKKGDDPSPSCPWYTLCRVQRQRLAATRETVQLHFAEELLDPAVPNKIHSLMQVPTAAKDTVESIVQLDNGTIVVPAGTCLDLKPLPTKMHQYNANGKRQVYLQDNRSLFYDISKILAVTTSCAEPKTTQYSLTLMVCTVHKQEERIKVVCNKNTNSAVVIDVPYTMGDWQETTPVVISLDEIGNTAGKDGMLLQLERIKQMFGVSIKELRLVQVRS